VAKTSITLAAIILAGGKSSRMGRDKALISIAGVPMIQQIYQVAQICTSEVYIVTSWVEKYQDILPNNCHLVRETEPQGPLWGFARGLTQASTDWVLLLACDLPKLKVEVLQAWTDRLADVPKEAIATLPKNPKGWEPLCGFYRCSCLPSLNEFLAGGGRSFQDWLARHLVVEIPISDREMLFNCNTPDDLARLKSC
jgi:molybdopterin-guanine dinucleotide biosynthesis protein A